MKLMQRYLLQEFLPVFFVSLLFFIVLLQLGDIFLNLWKYLSNNVSVKDILYVLFLYIPKCISYSMPLAVLFASSYTMGNLYARNELTSVFAAGYPLHFLIIPLLLLGFVFSVFLFYFENNVVISTFKEKNALVKVLLKQEDSLSNTNIVILSASGQVIYTSDYYQHVDEKLFSVLIIARTDDGDITSILQAPVAKWNGTYWVPDDFIVYSIIGDTVVTSKDSYTLILDEPPSSFRRNATSVDELSIKNAKIFLMNLRRTGLPYAEQLSNYYKRFSFPFTVFIVLFFSISLGGKFKKNILLMSLLISLSITVLFYVTQMVTMLFAKWEYVSPLVGAWFPVLLFFGISVVILRNART